MRVSAVIPLSMSTVVVASDQQISYAVFCLDDKLSVTSGDYYGLNPVAASIWRLVQQPRALADVRDALPEEYGGFEPQECEREMIAFVTQMHALDLVQVRIC